jgi:hypothetical protein
LLVAVIVKLKVLATVGVPVIAPELEFKLNPVGSAPEVTLYTIPVPVAVTDCE